MFEWNIDCMGKESSQTVFEGMELGQTGMGGRRPVRLLAGEKSSQTELVSKPSYLLC